jgi:hypothetical protein
VGGGVSFAVHPYLDYIMRTSYHDERVFRWKFEEKKVVRDGREPGRTWTQKQRNFHCWKTLLSRAMETVTENTSLCVICKV